jgi:A/G-specific adenine glycosylase
MIPENWEDLIGLPGIGHYMAGAILSIAFDQCFPAIDGNVRRVISRLFAIKEPINQPQTQHTVSNMVKALLPQQEPGRFNQAFMDLGATLCTPKKPDCKHCPLNNFCQAREGQLQHLLPVTQKRRPIPHNHMVTGIIRDTCHGQILITQRKAQGLLGGLWKIPGGKQNPGETSEIALKREIWDELGILIRVGEKIASVNHAYTHFRITLHAFHCTLETGEPKALGCADWRWIAPASFHHFAFSKVDRMVIQSLLHSPLPCFT